MLGDKSFEILTPDRIFEKKNSKKKHFDVLSGGEVRRRRYCFHQTNKRRKAKLEVFNALPIILGSSLLETLIPNTFSFHTQGLTPAPSFSLSCSGFNCVKANNHSKWRQNHPSVQILLPSPRPGDFKRSFTIYNCNILLLSKNISLGMAATFFILTISHGEMLATKKENFKDLDFQTYIDSSVDIVC